MHRVSQIMLIVAGIIHLLPLAGVMGPAHLARLYGVVLSDPDLIILMRHRAVLLAGAWRTELRPAAYGAGLVSVLSFLALAWSAGGYNPLIARVVAADVVAAVCLLLAVACDQLVPPKNC